MEPQSPPVMDVVPPPAGQAPVGPPTAIDKSEPPKPDTKAQAEAVAKLHAKQAPKNSGVTVAIVATVIIVLGLAALATYAYLKSK